MSLKEVMLVTLVAAILQGGGVESSGLVEMISDYAKVVKHTKKPTTETTVKEISNSTTEAFSVNETESTTEGVDYEDFDDLQEHDRSLHQDSPTNNMMSYFNGIVNLLALMYKFNGKLGGVKPQNLHFKNPNEPREKDLAREVNLLQEPRKHYHEAEDRFEFPQKKFRYQGGSADSNMIDQQYQPVENYPPYNPLTANSAETYDQDDKKTSYDSDLMHYDSSKNAISDYTPKNHDVEIQQSYSYEIPYETAKPVREHSYDFSANDDAASWTNQNIHPVYQPWMSKTPKDANPPKGVDTYQPWMTKTPIEDNPSMNAADSYQPWMTKIPSEDKPLKNMDSYQPWKSNIPVNDAKPPTSDSDSRQPWKGKLPDIDFPIYHHTFKDTPPADHHIEFHEIEHPVEEDRVSKKPYSYYFLGRKLWYIPLLFSVYFIIYIGALVLKSVARHKIQFPNKLWALHEDQYGHEIKHRRHRKIDEITENYENAMDNIKNKYM